MRKRLSDCNPTNDAKIEAKMTKKSIYSNSNKNNSSTHRFDFSGLEEVNKSICSNNNTIEELMVSPLNAETNTSQTATVALSLAESQLAEMKLKLAMTESERDELEFELMKSKG